MLYFAGVNIIRQYISDHQYYYDVADAIIYLLKRNKN